MPHRNSSGGSFNGGTIVLNDDSNSSSKQTKNEKSTVLGFGLSFDQIQKLSSFIRKEFGEIRHAVEYDHTADLADFHNRKEKKTEPFSSLNNASSIIIERQGGLANRFVFFLLVLWYFFSALTLYTNKYIVTTRKIDPTLIGTIQMFITSLCGFIQLKNTQWKRERADESSQLILVQQNNVNNSKSSMSHYMHFKYKYSSMVFLRNMFIIGFMRLFSIVLGLMALKSASVSFVETIKSSSPIFTVFVSKYLIGEITGFYTKCSLFPIMFGLMLCSSFELNFSFFGFLAAILTNFTECLQMVFSKLLLCSDNYKFTPLEVQFFSSASSVIVLVPTCYFSVDFGQQSYNFTSLLNIFINGFSFHLQTLLAFTLMSYISPVTYSVCNTLKRAVLIWFSVYIFQNQVNYMSWIGTFLVIFGVFVYNHAKNMDKLQPNNASHAIVRKM